ncbi:hypothetical protein D623_10030945 [Myotis brandtii]|uniref:Uncharacterized protein n=1 Tax=Myotis brandtii TaxID=109478 RepID=S7MQM5_MYOBR|nr:hypothetical protein D623_10030945 [Myotis brandtii]
MIGYEPQEHPVLQHLSVNGLNPTAEKRTELVMVRSLLRAGERIRIRQRDQDLQNLGSPADSVYLTCSLPLVILA